MINEIQFFNIFDKLDNYTSIDDIFKDRLAKRFGELNSKINKTENLKFRYLIEQYEKNKDIKSLLQFLDYMPKEVDSNKNFIVSYLYSKFGGL